MPHFPTRYQRFQGFIYRLSFYDVVLPGFQLEFPILPNQLKVRAIRRNEARAMGSCRERNEHIEVQIAQLVRLESPVTLDLPENLSRLKPVLICRSEDRIVLLYATQEGL